MKLNPASFFRLLNELIFVLLGALMGWVALSRPYAFRPPAGAWIAVSVAMILWGVRALYRPGQWWARWENLTRGVSLVLVGLLLLAAPHAPFRWLGRLLGVAAVLLVLRGIVSMALVLAER
jgi:multisubunit Na+/H+ antiporter MnhG subunit